MATTPAPRLKESPRKVHDRIDMRLPPGLKAEIEKAASIKGLTLTDFIVQNAVACAKQTIRDYESWTLERPDAELFAAALTETASLGPQLTQVANRYKERFLRQ